ncbi:MAG: heme-binding domain-containing protein [Acidobacteria bacterium]|nr:heme-binding domain-containing protein [Acidobacteriota bacterium]MCA1639198.1 heme-binding domain-containing protein [Acidobacteriota bacterium]
MKKAVKIIAIVLAVAFFAIQFYRPDRTNPLIVEAETLEASTQVPENVQKILERSCNDCHSNKTVYPWYSNISPFSWMLVDHINEGRRELNFSAWGTYTNKRKRHKLDETCEQITDGLMPHNQYLWIHRDARLSEADKKILCDWAETEKAKLPEV